MELREDEGGGCSRVRGRLERLLDGGLSPLEEARDRGHLEACAGCRRERARWEELLRGIETLGRREAAREDARLAGDVLAALAGPPAAPRARRKWLAPAALVGVAAAVLALARVQAERSGVRPAPRLVDLVALDPLLARLPSWMQVRRGLEDLSRRISGGDLG